MYKFFWVFQRPKGNKQVFSKVKGHVTMGNSLDLARTLEFINDHGAKKGLLIVALRVLK